MPVRRSIATIHFSIDSHHLILIEADGTLISPVLLTEVSVAPGQRYSVVLKPFNLIGKPDEFLLRLRLDQE
jgi:FtsP/CotA-like multicopper oxidase with cupredoxin domain